jgi:NADH-quinone oxidoreductase subunit J
MGLLLTMFSMAVFYVLNDAHFVAAVQVIIYAGAVMTLFLFVIMLIGVDKEEGRDEEIPFQRPLVAVLGAGLILLIVLAGRTAWVVFDTGGAPVGTIENIADELFGTWMLPFQATILLLTIAAVGSVALARYEGVVSRSAGDSSSAVPNSGGVGSAGDLDEDQSPLGGEGTAAEGGVGGVGQSPLGGEGTAAEGGGRGGDA